MKVVLGSWHKWSSQLHQVHNDDIKCKIFRQLHT